jgi:undecaprenyl-diphosphatase
LFGWNNITKSQSGESFFLAFLVVLHVATALALLIFYWREWVKIIGGFFKSVTKRKAETSYEKLAWLIIFATIPAGLVGVIFEHSLREQFAKPMSAAIFLVINGFILWIGDQAIRAKRDRTDFDMNSTAKNTSKIGYGRAGIIGVAQVGALFAGISRSGITMVSGIFSGLDHEDAARFSFLLATPIIFAAGVYKIPDLAGHLGDGVRAQALVGSLFAGIAAYISVRFLMRFFETRNLMPFAIYCLVFGAISIVRFA